MVDQQPFPAQQEMYPRTAETPPLVVFAFNMVGDGLRDALDPRLRGLL